MLMKTSLISFWSHNWTKNSHQNLLILQVLARWNYPVKFSISPHLSNDSQKRHEMNDSKEINLTKLVWENIWVCVLWRLYSRDVIQVTIQSRAPQLCISYKGLESINYVISAKPHSSFTRCVYVHRLQCTKYNTSEIRLLEIQIVMT